jgi:hypothetical protein
MEHAPVSDLSRIVKAYDVRGTVPDQLNETVAEALGTAFVQTLGAAAGRIVLAHDMRESGPGLVAAFARGARAAGAGIVDAGLGSTDLLYFASGAPLTCRRPCSRARPQTRRVQRHQAVPGRCADPSVRTPAWPRIRDSGSQAILDGAPPRDRPGRRAAGPARDYAGLPARSST